MIPIHVVLFLEDNKDYLGSLKLNLWFFPLTIRDLVLPTVELLYGLISMLLWRMGTVVEFWNHWQNSLVCSNAGLVSIEYVVYVIKVCRNT